MSGRYVLLGLANPRNEWFRRLAQWCNGGALPAELIKCLSSDEIKHRLDAGRPASAVVVDAGMPGIDRDLLNRARAAGCAVIVVDDARVTRDWVGLGASVVLHHTSGRSELLDALATHATAVDRAADGPITSVDTSISPLHGDVIAVTGPGGTGVSTVAIATAQGLAMLGKRVVLADLKLHAEQTMLHDVTRPTAGLIGLVDAHRLGVPSPDQVRDMCLQVPRRGYDLLPGIQRARFWSSVRPVAFGNALATLTNLYDFVVCDVDADVEREDTGGSLDVEERTTMSRGALNEAAAVIVVGHPSMKGLHAMNRLLIDLDELGIDMARIVPVFNQAARSPRVRAGYNTALAELIEWRRGTHPSVTPLHLPARDIDDLLRSGAPLPDMFTDPLGAAVGSLTRPSAVTTPATRFKRVRPGSLTGLTQEAS